MIAGQLERLMELALEEADRAAAAGDVPVGAVLVDASGRVLGRGHNRREALADPTAHAELEALRAAAAERGHWRLDGTTLLVTLEPCLMCAGALLQARVARVAFGCADDKSGALASLFVVGRDPRLVHRFEVVSGVSAAACLARLRTFFAARRGGAPGA